MVMPVLGRPDLAGRGDRRALVAETDDRGVDAAGEHGHEQRDDDLAHRVAGLLERVALLVFFSAAARAEVVSASFHHPVILLDQGRGRASLRARLQRVRRLTAFANVVDVWQIRHAL
jgi:hypothetical protein